LETEKLFVGKFEINLGILSKEGFLSFNITNHISGLVIPNLNSFFFRPFEVSHENFWSGD